VKDMLVTDATGIFLDWQILVAVAAGLLPSKIAQEGI
jgi:hypothetical protein